MLWVEGVGGEGEPSDEIGRGFHRHIEVRCPRDDEAKTVGLDPELVGYREDLRIRKHP
jgi:hypothetical protein